MIEFDITAVRYLIGGAVLSSLFHVVKAEFYDKPRLYKNAQQHAETAVQTARRQVKAAIDQESARHSAALTALTQREAKIDRLEIILEERARQTERRVDDLETRERRMSDAEELYEKLREQVKAKTGLPPEAIADRLRRIDNKEKRFNEALDEATVLETIETAETSQSTPC